MCVMSAGATEDGVVRFGDLRVGYSLAGEGQALVLLHGFFGDSRVWRPQLEELSDEFAVVAWDAPGAGRSADPAETFRMPEYADCLAGFIGFLGLERPCVVGLSFGATLALELFRRHPEVPRALVLVGAYAGWAGFGQGERLADPQAGAPQDHDQRPQPGAVWSVARSAHDGDYLVDCRGVSRIVQAFVPWRSAAVVGGHGGWRAAMTSSI